MEVDNGGNPKLKTPCIYFEDPIWMFPEIGGVSPKMDGENNGTPFFRWMIWEYPYFWKRKHPYFLGWKFTECVQSCLETMSFFFTFFSETEFLKKTDVCVCVCFLGYFGEDGVVVVAKKIEAGEFFLRYISRRFDTATEVSLV